MTHGSLREEARHYYEARLRAHGATPAGMDWNSQASQELRFQQVARLWEHDRGASILDYGCGYGGLATYVRAAGHTGAYLGYDVSPAMIDAARAHLAGVPAFQVTSARDELWEADYAVASGVLNVKQDAGDDEWTAYAYEIVAELAGLGSRGFAFNALTSYSDVEKRRPELYYADPLALFDHCKRTYSRFVTLVHDYPLYEFTLLVRR